MTQDSVTWKWLVGILVAVLMAGGGAWMTALSSDVEKMKTEYPKQVGELDKKVGIIEERTKRLEGDVQELKRGQERQSEKLDELLRRTPPPHERTR